MSFFRSIVEWLYSYWRIHFRKRIKEPIKFSFIAHPRKYQDVYNKFPYIKLFSEKKRRLFLQKMWPLVTSKMETKLKTARGEMINGHFINIPTTPELIFRNQSIFQKKVYQSVKLGRNMGSNTIGLGALIPPLVKDTRELENDLGVQVTKGFAFSIIITLKNIDLITKLFNINFHHSTVAIVGASQKTGYFVTQKLYPKVKKIYLIDQIKRQPRLQELYNELDPIGNTKKIDLYTNTEICLKADIILIFTSAKAMKIESKNLSPGTIIIDDTQPSAIPLSLVQEREDVVIIDGGIINLPGFNPHFRLGLLRKEDMWGCLAETIILAWLHGQNRPLNISDFHKDPEHYLAVLEESAQKIGFVNAELRTLGRYRIKEKSIKRIMEIRREKELKN